MLRDQRAFVPSSSSMEAAIANAYEASQIGNYPIGSVIEKNGLIISSAFTELHTSYDPTAHAEVLAIRRAAIALESRNLEGCVLYTTLEPCPMCTSAAIWARMAAIVFGATQLDAFEKAHKARPTIGTSVPIRGAMEMRSVRSVSVAESNFTWRQIDMRCAEVAKRATPGIEICEGYMRERCLELFELTDSPAK